MLTTYKTFLHVMLYGRTRTMRHIRNPFIMLAIVSAPLQAELKVGENAPIVFATVEQGTRILTSSDDFVQRMSPFDRSARVQTDRDVSEPEYLQHVASQVLAWNSSETKKVEAAIAAIQSQLSEMKLPLGGTIYLIKTTGKEEGGAPYTRGSAIVFPENALRMPASKAQEVLCHELFHILSRSNDELREKLYRAIGFEKCNEVAFPPSLASRKLTNPDAPKNDHCIRLTIDKKEQWVVPILFSNAERYDVKKGGPFFNYLQFRWLVVERDGDAVEPVYVDGEPTLVEMQQASGFFEQVGQNTQYIIHPEEILADNFAMLVTQEKTVPSPEILEKLRRILKDG
jgi:hypothetical protein